LEASLEGEKISQPEADKTPAKGKKGNRADVEKGNKEDEAKDGGVYVRTARAKKSPKQKIWASLRIKKENMPCLRSKEEKGRGFLLILGGERQ